MFAPPENLVSRNEFGSPVPRQPAHLHTQAESGAYLRDFSRVPRRRSFIYLKPPYTIRSVHTPSGQSRINRVTQLRIDSFNCRESIGTGPVSLKVIPNECWQVTMDQFICASLSHTHCYWYEVGMLKVQCVYVHSGDTKPHHQCIIDTYSVLS